MKAAALEDNCWVEDAVATIVALSLKMAEFTADDLRQEMREPASPYWPGQAFAKARNLGHIQAGEYKKSTARTRKHGSLRTWTRKTTREGTPCSTASKF